MSGPVPSWVRRPLALIGAAALAATAGVATTTPPAVAGGSKWVTVSGSNISDTLSTPVITRVGSGYFVGWTAHTGVTQSIQGRLLTATGKTNGSVVTVLPSWQTLKDDPAITQIAGQLYLGFGGYNGGAYDQTAFYYLTSSDGATWTLSTGSLTSGGNGSSGLGMVDYTGQVLTGYAFDQGVRYHLGVSSSNPAPGSDTLTSTTGPNSSKAGLGVDAVSGAAVAVWYDDDGGGGHDGVWAQQILPTTGSLVHGPQSSSNGGTNAYGVQQDLTVAARTTGGLYTAYVTPLSQSVAVWKIGASKPAAILKDSHGPSNVIVAAAPQGRIWVFWRDGAGWNATRSNKKVTKFEPVSFLKPPSGDSVLQQVAGDGSAGSLEAVVLVQDSQGHDQVLAERVLPRVSVGRSPGTVKRGSSFTVSVKDAGDAVAGAKVTFDGMTKKTSSKGTVAFKVPGSLAPGKYAIKVVAHGYKKATSHEVVTN